jgi:hypothetical protein
MVAQEMKRTWHWTPSFLAMGMTWEVRVTSVMTAETRGAAPAMSGPMRCAERRRASQRTMKGSRSWLGNSDASMGRRWRYVDAADAGEGSEEAAEMVGLGGRDGGKNGHHGDIDVVVVPRERRDEAEEREEVAHAGARDEHDMRP